MSATLVAEPQARALASAANLVVREKRGLGLFIVWLCLSGVFLAGVSYPFWRVFLHDGGKMPSVFAVLAGLFCLLFVLIMGQELRAARQPSNWLLISGMNTLYLKFRAFQHWRWPEQDRVVLQLSSLDIDFIQPIEDVIKTTGRKGDSQVITLRSLEFHLREALMPEQIEAIQYENTHAGGSGKARWRSGHRPVQSSADGRIVSLDCSASLIPAFLKIIEVLASSYPMRPVAGVDMSATMASSLPPLTARKLREASLLAASGDKIGAIRLLRDYTALSLKDAKNAVDSGVENSLAHLVQKNHDNT